MLKQINIQNLQPGMVIVRVTKQNGPVKIKKAGLVTSQDMVQGLIEMGIQQVEIDPDQTVEVEAPRIKKSTTRRMLESNTVNHTRANDGLSDQFHRNLYLPSVQDIPSPWQLYTKRYLLAAFIVLSGLSLGWSLANYQAVFGVFSSEEDTPVDAVVVSDDLSLEQPNKQLDNAPQSSTQSDDSLIIEPNQKVATSENQLATTPKEQITQDTSNPEATSYSATTETETNDSELSEGAATDSEVEISGTQEPEPQISADVLARFKKAISDVEESPTVATPVEPVSSSNNVPRIDQLPPWAMTRLPRMAFSAHMYASVESERWVRVNGIRMVEGDKIDDMIEIVRIEPQHVILNFSGQTFSMAALTDW
ncbi:general secretion pathway protein GspB [Paraglaciecola arctica]|uniref:general secretion pathway protein GspB n=1 Tax=Paraglaciecola arctica TaxID=1128911 RepID=UPI001C07A26A|nr:general secretion pathway protein GspB [Paraglaciecola arctica]MBU3004160.1 general secretion pathway protein GspB [Paraglaciecola arctica]